MEKNEFPHVLIASAVAVTMLAAGCSSGGSGGGAPQYKPEKTNIVVDAFPAIDSAGLYIAQDQGQLKGKVVSVNAPNDIGTLLIDSLLVAHGLKPGQVHYANVPFPAVAPTLMASSSPVVASFAPSLLSAATRPR
jgi:ABC-type nitrate/sulfonate/bicarbonate transport system substrate-binding protein